MLTDDIYGMKLLQKNHGVKSERRDLENAKAKEQDKLEMVAEYTNSNN